MPKPDATGALYRYRDADGAWVYTNDLDAVPEAVRATIQKYLPQASVEDTATRVKADATAALEALPARAKALGQASKRRAETVQREVGDVLPFVKDLDLPSVAVGFAGALVLWVASAVVRRTGRLLFKLAGLLLVVALVVGAYFGWLRRAAGLGEGRLATPKAMVDDAQKAADKLRQRLEHDQRVLEQLEESSR